jgi:hypothetical protein
MKYELWEAEDEQSKLITYSFFPEDNESAPSLLKANAKLIWTVEADFWVDACLRKDEFLGWQPYRPAGE